MTIRGYFRSLRTKYRFARQDRIWNRSARKKQIDAERDLPPRPLTAEEFHLLRWILENGSEEARFFLPQVEGIRAVRSCTCGCPSIRLEVNENAPPGKSSSDLMLSDWIGNTAKGELVGIMLLQVGGKLCEMEIYSLNGDIRNDCPEFGLPTIESMRPFEAGNPSAPNVLTDSAETNDRSLRSP